MKTNKNNAYRKMIRTVSNHVKHYSFDMMIDFAHIRDIEEDEERKTFKVYVYYRNMGTWICTDKESDKLRQDYANHSDRVFTLEKKSEEIYEVTDSPCR